MTEEDKNGQDEQAIAKDAEKDSDEQEAEAIEIVEEIETGTDTSADTEGHADIDAVAEINIEIENVASDPATPQPPQDEEKTKGNEEAEKKRSVEKNEDRGKKQKKKPNKVVIAVIALVVVIAIIVAAVVGMNVSEKNAYNNYVDKLTTATNEILYSAADCEEICNGTTSIWRSAIWDDDPNEWDAEYRKFFATDFNEALAKYYADSSISAQVKSIKSDMDEIGDAVKALDDPPKGCEKAFDALEALYESYYKFAQLAVSPTGSYSSYSAEFNELDSESISLYETAKRKIPEKK